MRGMKIVSSVAVGIIASLAWLPASQAIPINESTLDQQGALFTIEGEWVTESTYQLTYWANFEGYENDDGQDFLRAIDWQWQGGAINTVSLVAAPGSLSDWAARPFYQIDYSGLVQCAEGGGVSAVCTEYVGEDLGLSTSTQGDLAWIFDISFKDVRQQDLMLGRGPRAGLLGDSLLLATPFGITTTSFDPEEPDRQVPAPSVLYLILIGLGALATYRRKPLRSA